MRHVKKSSPEPSGLLEYRKTQKGPTDWDSLSTPTKDAIRNRLIEDQGYLCCYCMRRISSTEMKMEHYVPRRGPDGDPERELDWSNMLAACDGNEGRRWSDQTCDTRKGSRKLELDPQNSAHIRDLGYLPDGRLKVRSGDERRQQDIDDTLNLNSTTLKRNRKNALDGFLQVLERKLCRKSKWSARKLDRELQTQRDKAKLPGYFGVFEKWLEREIGRRND